jgi:D-alanyl-D-alanine carboxypeptidase
MKENRKIRKEVLFALVALSFFCDCSFKTIAQEKLPFSLKLQEALDDGLKTTGGSGISAAVIVSGKGEWRGTSGMSDKKLAKPLKPEMLFDAASIGKTFTAALVLQLTEEGRLTLDDTLGQWLPAFANIDSAVTIRQLLNHTSGLAHYTENTKYWKSVLSDLDRIWTPADILALTPKAHYAPGKGWHYSSANYILLGMIAEKATESTLAKELRKRFFIPLNLKNTFTPLESAKQLSGAYAHAHYDLDGDGELDDMASLPRRSIFSSVWAAGPVVSTAEDIARWADLLYRGRVLQKEALTEMVTFHRPTPGEELYSGYGLGTCEYLSKILAGDEAWGHLGWQPGYMGVMMYFPKYSVSLVALINDNNEDCIRYVSVSLWQVIKKQLKLQQ